MSSTEPVNLNGNPDFSKLKPCQLRRDGRQRDALSEEKGRLQAWRALFMDLSNYQYYGHIFRTSNITYLKRTSNDMDNVFSSNFLHRHCAGRRDLEQCSPGCSQHVSDSPMRHNTARRVEPAKLVCII